MRSSAILTWLLATLVLANPVDKRQLTTKVEIFTVWTTVTKGAAATSYGSSGGRHRHRFSSGVAESSAVPTSSDVVVQTSTSEVVPPPSEAVPTPSEVASTQPEVASIPSEAGSTPTEATPTSSQAPIPTSELAPAPETSAPSAPSPAPASKGATSSYGQNILDQHNIHRANHTNTGPLSWSDQLAATALKIAKSCVYQHDTQTDKAQYSQGYGQNIGAGAPGDEVPAMITNGMYNDEAPAYEGLYGQDNPDMSNFHTWGHFSQIAWRSTKEVGCATVQCGTLQNAGANVRPFFTVCNYSPPGNFGGQYSNVGTRLGKATVSI